MDAYFSGYIAGWNKKKLEYNDPIFNLGYEQGRIDKTAWMDRSQYNASRFGPGGENVGCHFGIAYANGYVGTGENGNSAEWHAVYLIGEADRKRDSELEYLHDELTRDEEFFGGWPNE